MSKTATKKSASGKSLKAKAKAIEKTIVNDPGLGLVTKEPKAARGAAQHLVGRRHDPDALILIFLLADRTEPIPGGRVSTDLLQTDRDRNKVRRDLPDDVIIGQGPRPVPESAASALIEWFAKNGP